MPCLISNRPNIYRKEQAVKELEEELGENPETFLGFNPLQASIEVKLHSEYANADSLQLIEKKIKIYFRSRSALPERHDADGERQCETCQPDLAYTCRNVDGNLVLC